MGVTREPGLVSNPLERRKRRLPNLVEQCVDVAQVGALGEEKMTAKRAPAGKKQVSVSIETARVEHGKDAVAAIGHIAGAPRVGPTSSTKPSPTTSPFSNAGTTIANPSPRATPKLSGDHAAEPSCR